MIRITIQFEGGETVSFEHERVELSQERGVDVRYRGADPKAAAIECNGHSRLSIRAWSGSAEYDGFSPGRAIEEKGEEAVGGPTCPLRTACDICPERQGCESADSSMGRCTNDDPAVYPDRDRCCSEAFEAKCVHNPDRD